MDVLVDTSVWSNVLRRKSPDLELSNQMQKLIEDSRVCMIGPIRQEILSGVKDVLNFERLKNILNNFSDIKLQSEDFELAAKMFNTCKNKGIQGSNTDFLICAISKRYKLQIFTTDKDFDNYAKVLAINLYKHSPNTQIDR